jgi:hypothetical protein
MSDFLPASAGEIEEKANKKEKRKKDVTKLSRCLLGADGSTINP